MKAPALLVLIGVESAIAVALSIHPPRVTARNADVDCVSVREGLAIQIGTTLDLELNHARTDPTVSPAVAAMRGASRLWPKVPPSPNDPKQPAFQLVESTDYVPVRRQACTAYVLADPAPEATAVVIRQFARDGLGEIAVQPGQRLVPPA